MNRTGEAKQMEPQIKQMKAEELDVKLKEMGSPFFYQTLKN